MEITKGGTQLIINKNDLAIIDELRRNVMVPKAVQGFLVEPYKYSIAMRSFFIQMGLHPPYDVVLSIYPDGILP